MTDVADDLIGIGRKAQSLADSIDLEGPVHALEKAGIAVAKAWSGSPLGYHANVYVDGLRAPRPGERFSMEWGLMDRLSNEEHGYSEYDPQMVKDHILKKAGNPDLEPLRKVLSIALTEVASTKAAAQSALSVALDATLDSYLVAEARQLETIEPLTELDAVRAQVPGGDLLSRDSTAIHQGRRVAPHQEMLGLPLALRSAKVQLDSIARIARQSGEHLQRRRGSTKLRAQGRGSKVFIGHGRSPLWRDLKDFIGERLKLQYDEFNSVPIAGVPNVIRLAQMLDDAAIAFIVMTAEDELADGATQPRMNVVHEAGLFQGRLGFTKAIVLLEDGCKDFSNIDGLGQIRFPKGDIRNAFEEVRRVLEREGVLSP